MRILKTEQLGPHRYKDNHGYLICTDCIMARTGKQTYTRDDCFGDGDQTEIEVDRDERDVFDPKTLASFENVPITIEHPDSNVDPDNYNSLSVGYMRDIHRGTYEGRPVMMGTAVITDSEGIEKVESGELTNLSCGYDCDVDNSDHPHQTNIRGNHIALCEVPRAGITHIQDSCRSIADMALSRTDAMDRCISLGEQFIRHFDKIYNDSSGDSVSHWCNEMQSWLDKVQRIKLKATGKTILNGSLRDWFFTAAANPEDFMESPNSRELKLYDDFVTSVIQTKNVKESIKNTFGIKMNDSIVVPRFVQKAVREAQENGCKSTDEIITYLRKKFRGSYGINQIYFWLQGLGIDDMEDNKMRKDSEDQEIIIAFLKNGGRLYYDESENDWSDNKADASRYSHQDARKKWAELTKGGRKLPDQRFRNLFCVVDKKTQDDIVKTPKGWANKGREGTHGHFSTKKAAREQQKAMFANGYKGDSGNYSEDEEFVNDSISRVWDAAFEKIYHRDGSKTDYRDVVREMLRIQPELTKRELLRWNADTSTTPNYSGDDDLEIEAAIHDVFRGKSESKDNRSQEYIVEAKSAKDALDKVKKMRDMSRHTPVSNYPRHAIPAHYVSAKVVQPKTDFHNDMSSDKFRNDLYNAQKANNIDIFKGDIAEIIEDCKADRNMSRSWGAHYKKYKNVLINFNAIPGIFSAAVTKGINDFIALGI